MTKEEIKKALPEMILYSKKDSKEKKHYEKLANTLEETEFELEVETYMQTIK
jgi:hypothetical protein